MPADLDPIAVLARTDPAAARPMPDRPTLADLVDRPDDDADRPNRSRAVVLVAAVVLAVLVAGTAVVWSTRGDDGSTPPVTEPPATTPGPGPARLPLTMREPARDHLLALASRVEALDPTLGTGTVAYSRIVVFFQELTRPGDPTSLVADSSHLEIWTGPDFVVRVDQGTGPAFRDGRVVQMEPDPPRPADVESRPQERMDTIPRDLPDDPDQLAMALLQGAATADNGTLLRAATALGEEARTGADRASVYRALADLGGLEYRGPVVDRAGRDGIAFSTSHGGEEPEEAVLVVDPRTGIALGRESISPERQPAMPFDGPTVQTSWTYLDAAYVAAPGDLPS